MAVLNQIRAVDRRRLIRKLGAADGHIMLQVDFALKIAFDLTTTDPDSGYPILTKAISESTQDLKTSRYEP